MKKNIPSHNLIDTDYLPYKIAKLDFSGGHEIDEAHRHNGYQIFLFTKTGGTHMIDFNYCPIDKNSIHFLTEDQIHSLNSNDNTEGYVIIFSKDMLYLNNNDDFIINDFPVYNKSAAPFLMASNSQFEELMDIFTIMKREFDSNNDYKENIIGRLISVFLLKCRQLINQKEEKSDIDIHSRYICTKFYNLVEKHFLDYHQVKDYAELMHLSPNHLSNTIKLISGKTAGDIIHHRILLEAKRRLLHSPVSVKELAFDLNFNDASYFSRFFKKLSGLSPEAFRKEIRKKYRT